MSAVALVVWLVTGSLQPLGGDVRLQDVERGRTDATGADAAFRKFWAAPSRTEAARAADEIVRSGIAFDDAWARLKRGRAYTAQAAGVVQRSHRADTRVEHFFSVDVPPGYDPARRYQVRFHLHGGVGGRDTNQPRGSGKIGALAASDEAPQFYVLPYSWSASPWWSEDQVLSLAAIVDHLKRTYNIDENRVVMSGFSDGGTGAYYLAMRDTTPYASFTPLNAFIMVLGNREIDDGRLYPNNLLNKPLFVVNGGRDRLYPTSLTEPFVLQLRKSGVEMAYHPLPEAGHDTAWWPGLKDTYEAFVASHPRDPHPPKVTWETADLKHNRAHWIVIDEFGSRAGDARNLKDINVFERRRPSGRVDAVRSGNTITAATRGAAAVTFLLSPDVFDFSQPLKVVVNDRVMFDGRVERRLATLLKWAALDNDRTMLYGAEIKLRM